MRKVTFTDTVRMVLPWKHHDHYLDVGEDLMTMAGIDYSRFGSDGIYSVWIHGAPPPVKKITVTPGTEVTVPDAFAKELYELGWVDNGPGRSEVTFEVGGAVQANR